VIPADAARLVAWATGTSTNGSEAIVRGGGAGIVAEEMARCRRLARRKPKPRILAMEGLHPQDLERF
jgi:hypothetical protein